MVVAHHLPSWPMLRSLKAAEESAGLHHLRSCWRRGGYICLFGAKSEAGLDVYDLLSESASAGGGCCWTTSTSCTLGRWACRVRK